MCNYPVSNIQYPLFNDGGANWILAVGYWLLDISCWILAVGYWILDICTLSNYQLANWILAVGYWIFSHFHISILATFPQSEVNYEQSIIAPAANFLCEIFLVTKGERPGLGARLRKPLAGERHLQAAGHHPRREKW